LIPKDTLKVATSWSMASGLMFTGRRMYTVLMAVAIIALLPPMKAALPMPIT
jgi:hypothetical protein